MQYIAGSLAKSSMRLQRAKSKLLGYICGDMGDKWFGSRCCAYSFRPLDCSRRHGRGGCRTHREPTYGGSAPRSTCYRKPCEIAGPRVRDRPFVHSRPAPADPLPYRPCDEDAATLGVADVRVPHWDEKQSIAECLLSNDDGFEPTALCLVTTHLEAAPRADFDIVDAAKGSSLTHVVKVSGCRKAVLVLR